jgi:succinate dehydrogenase/fumarate reductase flavoprotein subunit
LAGFLLFLGLIASLGMVAATRLSPDTLNDAATAGTAAQWQAEAETLQDQGQRDSAIEACRAGLVMDPWNPGLCRTLTQLHLEGEDLEALQLWMDDLVMGDARQAEQLFQLPGFSDRMENPMLLRIRREAQIQARD